VLLLLFSLPLFALVSCLYC